MAATTQLLSPAEAQPVAFTAEYLSWGISYLDENSCGHMIGRGLYSVGVIVVAPVGILYHLSMAAYGALAQQNLDEGKEKTALSTWTWQHLNAAGNDTFGWTLSLILPALIACAVAFSVLALKGEAVRGIGYLIPFIAMLVNDDFLYAIMPYLFATNPVLYTGILLDASAPEGAKSSQRDLYMMRIACKTCGVILNPPPNDAEIEEFTKVALPTYSKGREAFQTGISDHLKKFGRLKEAAPLEKSKKVEVKEDAPADWTEDLAGIKNQIASWNEHLSKLQFPCVIAARVAIEPPAGDKINGPYVRNLAFHFENLKDAMLVLNARYSTIKTEMEADRNAHVSDGKKSIGYIIPQCKIEMSLAHIRAKDADQHTLVLFKGEIGSQKQTTCAAELQKNTPLLLDIYKLAEDREQLNTALEKLNAKG